MKNKRRTSSPDKMRYMPGSSSVASARYHAVEAVDPDDLDDYYEDDCEDNEELVTEKGRVQVGRSVRVAKFRVVGSNT